LRYNNIPALFRIKSKYDKLPVKRFNKTAYGKQ